ncbi:MAG: RNA polymerase-binding protein RbpA [Actinomycetes bacterium]
MVDRVLRGTRMGSLSYETDDGADIAPRQVVTFVCARGHRTSVTFSVEAELPASWECRSCGASATISDGAGHSSAAAKPARTPWDMLMERRTISDLEELLSERLTLLRSGQLHLTDTPRVSSSRDAARERRKSA